MVDRLKSNKTVFSNMLRVSTVATLALAVSSSNAANVNQNTLTNLQARVIQQMSQQQPNISQNIQTPLTVPTLNPSDITQNGNSIIISGRKFTRYNGNTAFNGNGTIQYPLVFKAPTITYGNNVPLQQAMHIYLLNKWENPLDNHHYEGRKYYAFGVGVMLGYVNSAGMARPLVETIYLESNKRLGWIAWLKDMNTLYKYSNNTSEFVKMEVDAFDLSQIYRMPQPTYSVLRCPGMPNKIIQNSIPNTYLPPKDAFAVVRGMRFIYQREAAPAFGDGSKRFPYEIWDNPRMPSSYNGPGYYSFVMSNGLYASIKMVHQGAIRPSNIESAQKISSKEQLLRYFAAAYGTVPQRNLRVTFPNRLECIGMHVDGRDFITEVMPLTKGTVEYTDLNGRKEGSVTNPYTGTFNENSKGYYNIGGIITLVESQSDYNKCRSIISNILKSNSMPTGLFRPGAQNSPLAIQAEKALNVYPFIRNGN